MYELISSIKALVGGGCFLVLLLHLEVL